LAPNSFLTGGVDWLLERTIGTVVNGVSFSGSDFADDDALYLPSY